MRRLGSTCVLLVPFLDWYCYLSNLTVSQFQELNQQKNHSLFLARLVFCQFNSLNQLSKGIQQASAPVQGRRQEHTGSWGEAGADLSCHWSTYPGADLHHSIVRTDSNLCLYNGRPSLLTGVCQQCQHSNILSKVQPGHQPAWLHGKEEESQLSYPQRH